MKEMKRNGSGLRIPKGSYSFRVNDAEEPEYPGVPELIDVGNRTNVLIHWGSYPRNTVGCILIGKTRVNNNPAFISQTRDAVAELKLLIDPNEAEGIEYCGRVNIKERNLRSLSTCP